MAKKLISKQMAKKLSSYFLSSQSSLWTTFNALTDEKPVETPARVGEKHESARRHKRFPVSFRAGDRIVDPHTKVTWRVLRVGKRLSRCVAEGKVKAYKLLWHHQNPYSRLHNSTLEGWLKSLNGLERILTTLK